MKMNTRILATVAGALLASHAAAANLVPPPAIEQQVRQTMEQAQVPGLAIAKIEDGRIAWHGAYGERAPGESLALDTVFNVASLTKPVFAAMALTLATEDRLELDESLAKYWVDPDIAGDPRHRQLTPRILLSHQSGLPNWRGNRPLAFMFDPGTRHEYSGEGYEYLRRAVERKTGSSLETLLQAKVFEPVGMKNTSAGWQDAFEGNVARGYNEAGEVIETGLEQREPNAAANLMTTVDDYAHFAVWISSGAGLPPELLEEMQTPQAMNDDPAERFGLGWKLIPPDGGEALMHDGREPGVRTYAVVVPASNEALVIFTNSSNGELSFRPLVNAALSSGDELLESTDRLVWRYLVHLPPLALVPMSRGIARSPSYLSTLLHAVDTALVQASPLSAQEKKAARDAIEPYVIAHLAGEVDPAQAEKLVEQLLVKEGDSLRLVENFDAAAARNWLVALHR